MEKKCVTVWGCVETTADQKDTVIQLSLEHVQRSRAEPGCLSHSVQIDIENPNRLIFFEEWEDMAALQKHFEVPESQHFVQQVGAMSVAPPELRIYESNRIR